MPYRVTILVTIVMAGLLAAVQAAGGAEAAEPEAEAGIGGGGMAATLLFLDLSELNRVLEANGYGPLPDRVFLMGGSGFGGEVRPDQQKRNSRKNRRLAFESARFHFAGMAQANADK